MAVDETILVGNVSGQLLAVGPSGTKRWEFSAGVDQFTYPTIAPDGSVVALGGYRVAAGDATIISNHLFSVTSAGQKRWETELGSAQATAPAVGRDGTVYLGAGSKLLAIDRSGRKHWEFPTGFTVSSPSLGVDGTLYFGSGDSNVYAVSADGMQKWLFRTGGAVSSTPSVAADGTIYVGSGDHKLYALNADGSRKWEFLADWAIDGSPLIGPDGTIYVSSVSSLYALKGSSPLAPSCWPTFRANVARTGRTFQIGFEQFSQPSPGLLRLSLAIELNISYTVEVSTDLREWSAFTTVRRTNASPFYLDITTSDGLQKFYQLRAP
jgi:outer membrane protein assembly factor BamB